jgi:SAM-dependent methyltransferase
MNKIHEANQKNWDSWASSWGELRDKDGLWQRCIQEPALAFDGESLELICEFQGDLHGKHVCVIGSGDNYAAFALAGMGAEVTSTDISEKQLELASHRANILGLNIRFVRADAANLEGIDSSCFDLVCSTNGFFVWISDPGQVFKEVFRVLKPGGYYITYDIHPFMRPWKDQISPIEMEKPYSATGPFKIEKAGLSTYEFNWRISDIINPLLASGLQLQRLIESPPKGAQFWLGNSYVPGTDDNLMDWKNNPRAGLPVWLTLAAKKHYMTKKNNE